MEGAGCHREVAFGCSLKDEEEFACPEWKERRFQMQVIARRGWELGVQL